MRILALTWPTEDKEGLMLNRRRDLLCPAIDGITDELLKLGHSVVYVNLAADCCEYEPADLGRPAWISGLPFYRWHDIRNKNFDLVWHAIKDPTPSQALPYVERVMQELDSRIPVFNSATHLQDHTKRKYLPLLAEKTVGVPILDRYSAMETEDGRLDVKKCHAPSNGAYVSLDRQAIRLHAKNSSRHSLDVDGITLKYQDNVGRIEPGLRSFFRVPFAAGRCLPGFRYFCPADILCPKSGNAVKTEPFEIDGTPAGTISAAMKELGVDIAHIEGVNIGPASVQVFDVNPFPSSYGRSLTPMSVQIAKRVTQALDL